MKKIISIIITLCIAFSCTSVFAREVTVNLNGQKMEFDVNPFIEDGRTLVPMRAIFEAIGASVTWDGETRLAIALYQINGEPNHIALQIDNKTAHVNDSKVELDVPARIVGDRTFVPLRFISETIGKTVTWNQDTYTVDIND